MTYQRKSDTEIKQLAMDVVDGKVFGTWVSDQAGLAFSLVTMLLDPATLDGMRADKICQLYEYLDKAGPRSVNGMPSFMSAQMLDREDTDRMLEAMKAYRKLQKEFMGESP